MRWRDLRQSTNVRDRRGGSGMAVGGGIGTIVIALIAYFFGFDPGVVTDQAPQQPGSQYQTPADRGQDTLAQFVSAVLGSTEDVWNDIFRRENADYREPTLNLFSGQVQSACGMAGAAVGPFYCPRDGSVYIDLSFYRALRDRLGAPGDFAQAYVIAHEVGHHVQNLVGVSERVRALQSRASKAEANDLSVRLELQADFFAGVWAHYAQRQGVLEPGDIEEALRAAAAIGDDRLQKESQGYVVPETFTHGTSEQRARWFRRGLETGDPDQGDTFKASRL